MIVENDFQPYLPGAFYRWQANFGTGPMVDLMDAGQILTVGDRIKQALRVVKR